MEAARLIVVGYPGVADHAGLVFEGPVKSGFLAQNGLTETVTGPRPIQEWTRTAKDRKTGLFRLINRLRQVKTRAGYN